MINKYFCTAMAVLTVVGMIMFPNVCMKEAEEGINLCVTVIIPSLFSFIVCAKIIIKSGLAEKIGSLAEPLMRPLFNVPGCGSFAFVLGILSGYPIGAKCAAELYENNMCTKAEAERLVCFCNNSGPLFIIGAVGVGMLGSKTLGMYLYLAHILSALTVGVIMGFYKRKEPVGSIRIRQKQAVHVGNVFSSAITESVTLIFYICGFVVFFSVLLGFISYIAGDLMSPVGKALFYGSFEMVNGVKKACAVSLPALRTVLISMIIAWGGVSVLLQVFGVTEKHGFSQKAFIGAKALQSIISGFYMLIFLNFPMGNVPVIASSSYNVTSAVIWAYALSLMASSVILFLFLSVIVFMVKIVNKL